MTKQVYLPKLYRFSGGNLSLVKVLHPINVSLELSATPLSTATIEMPSGEELRIRDYVEMFTPFGSAGIFRVRNPQISYSDDSSVIELEHSISEAGDWIVTSKYEGTKKAKTAIQNVWSHYRGTMWHLGDVDISALNNTDVEISIDHDSVLDAIIEIIDQVPGVMMNFEYISAGYANLNFRMMDSTVTAEGRLSRNVESATVEFDDTDLCTRVYYTYSGSDSWSSITAPSEYTNRYGIMEHALSTSADTQEKAKVEAQNYLRTNREPKVNIEIEAIDLHEITGVGLDQFALGKYFRLVLSDFDETYERNITRLSWDDVYGDPYSVVVTLADGDPELWGYLRKKKK